MSLHKCQSCLTEVATNSTSAGAFELPPTIVCLECGCEMEVLDPNAKVDMDKVDGV